MTELVGILAVAVVAWFAAGTIWNVRAGRETMRWMQGGAEGGLRLLGERTTVRWLGSTVVELVINQGKAQFAKVTVVIFLEPRDLPWWPLSRMRGRRDTLIVRGVLRRAPSFEFEALEPGGWSARDALPRVPRDWLVGQAAAPGGVLVHHAGAAALGHAYALLEIAQRAGMKVWRLSVRRAEPNFQLHVPLPDRGQSARDFFQAVCALADRVLA
jgi:hypothetical protein